jgi:hypothetical protein
MLEALLLKQLCVVIYLQYTLITLVSVSFSMTANSFFICSVETLDKYFNLVSCISSVIPFTPCWPAFRITSILYIMLCISCWKHSLWCSIWDFHSVAYEGFYLLGSNAAWSFEKSTGVSEGIRLAFIEMHVIISQAIKLFILFDVGRMLTHIKIFLRHIKNSILVRRPVARWWVCKQRQLLGNCRSRHAQQEKNCSKRCFLCRPCQDYIRNSAVGERERERERERIPRNLASRTRWRKGKSRNWDSKTVLWPKNDFAGERQQQL